MPRPQTFSLTARQSLARGSLRLVGTNYWANGLLEGIMTVASGSTLNIISGNVHDMPYGIIDQQRHGHRHRRPGAGRIQLGDLQQWSLAGGGGLLFQRCLSAAGLTRSSTPAPSARPPAPARPSLPGLWAMLFNNSGLVDAQSGNIEIEWRRGQQRRVQRRRQRRHTTSPPLTLSMPAAPSPAPA